MKAYALHLGDTRVPFAQFYGGGSSAREIFDVMRDRNHFIKVPVHSYLVEHPRHGLIMIDTGLNWQQAHAHREYYAGPLLRAAFDDGEYLMRQEQRLEAQLDRFGLQPHDVETVVLTHLHEDHLGNVRHLLHARVLVSRAEWTARNMGIFLFRRTPSLKHVLTKPELVDFTSGPHGPFAVSQDVFGDGSVVLLPTPGHSKGHTSVLLDADSGWQLLCTGDTVYTIRHMAVEQIQPIMIGHKGRDRQLDSIERLRNLMCQRPNLAVAPGHDHTDYGDALTAMLSGDEISSAQASAFRRKADSLFDADGNLYEPSHPVFHPDQSSQTDGTVVWE